MGKSDDRRLPLHQQQLQNATGDENDFRICGRCSVCLRRFISFKCFFVFLLSVAVFVSAVFWVLPNHKNRSGFDAKDSIKLSASVQACFKLDKTVPDLIPYITRLEYDIFGEIGVPYTKVAILSVHQADISNQTNVTFGVLSNPIDTSISPASLSLLKSSLVEIFLQKVNLILASSIFGKPSSFHILKVPGGVTLNPEPDSPFWQEQVLFGFTLNHSIGEIKENFAEFKKQLRSGLHLREHENVYVQLYSKKGSTMEPPISVEASIVSDAGDLTPERLRELAQTITGSPPATNLGLNNSVFGKVKEISLSSFLNHSMQASSPAPSPAPTQNDPEGPSLSPSLAHSPPCCDCDASPPSFANYPYGQTPAREPNHSLSPTTDSHEPHVPCAASPCGSRIPPSLSPTSHAQNLSPSLSPQAALSHGSYGDFVSSPQASPSVSSSLSCK